MSGIFRVGQLVKSSGLEDNMDLFSEPPPGVNGDLRIIGKLEKLDVAIVIALARGDCGCIYVLGPHGSGWAFGA